MSEIRINDIVDELIDENNRLLNQLLFANKCLLKLIEFKNFVNSVFIRIDGYLEPIERQRLEFLNLLINDIIGDKNICELNEEIFINIYGRNANEIQELNNCEIIEHKEEINPQIDCKTSSDNLDQEQTAQILITDKTGQKPETDNNHVQLLVPIRIISNTNDWKQKFTNVRSFKLNLKKKSTQIDFKTSSGDRTQEQTVISDNFNHITNDVNDQRPNTHNDHVQLTSQKRRISTKIITNKLFRCDVPGCNYSTNIRSNIKIHKTSHSNVKQFKCFFDGCEMTFKTKQVRNKHESTHSDDRPFVCDFNGCGKAFTVRDRLQRHKALHYNRVRVERGESKPFKCSYEDCDKEFLHQQSLEDHIQYFHYKDTKDMLKCEYQGCTFETLKPENLRKHFRSCHKEKNFKCDHPGCQYASYFQYRLNRHLLKHKNDKPFACDWPGCYFRAKYKEILTKHFITHQNNYDHKCTYDGCDKLFKSQFHVNSHIKAVHEKGKKIVCDWPGCSYRTHSYVNLKEHNSVHTNEKNFVCDRDGCEAKFKSLSGLIKHKNIFHDKIKRYNCTWPGCTFNCGSSGHLKRHMMIHTGEKPYACEWPGCEYRTNDKSHLKHSHMKKHIKK